VRYIAIVLALLFLTPPVFAEYIHGDIPSPLAFWWNPTCGTTNGKPGSTTRFEMHQEGAPTFAILCGFTWGGPDKYGNPYGGSVDCSDTNALTRLNYFADVCAPGWQP
jgi:hypothetical protein